MGHGDEIVIADANFPGVTCAKRLIRADGHSGTAILEAVLSLFPLDKVADKNSFLMAVSEKNMPNPPIWKEYENIMKKYEEDNVKTEELERQAFYDRAKNAFAVV
jgi:L-fucose mutarotase